jgi:hypothetical protein
MIAAGNAGAQSLVDHGAIGLPNEAEETGIVD